jgi:lipopolysaccharide transport system ATP-binding protein
MLDTVRGLRHLVGLGNSAPSALPTVFHVTHHKAGSQWINRIFHALTYERMVMPEVENVQFLGKPIVQGAVYPTVYVTREQFDSVAVPKDSRRFVVVRDIRDTLVSLYFSLRYTHPVLHERIQNRRSALAELSPEDGLVYLIETQLTGIAQFQWSWANAREELIRYEDLLERDEEILARVLLRKCRLGVDPGRFHEVVAANRFEARTGGRKPGQEDLGSHERKGVAGDWRNHFTEKVTKAFKRLYGSVLIATGYEKDFNW